MYIAPVFNVFFVAQCNRHALTWFGFGTSIFTDTESTKIPHEPKVADDYRYARMGERLPDDPAKTLSIRSCLAGPAINGPEVSPKFFLHS